MSDENTEIEPVAAIKTRSTMDLIKAALLSCGGLGYSPFASGTVGTAGAIGLIMCLYPLRNQEWFHFGGAMIALTVLSMIIGVALGPWAERYYGRKDPSAFVLDEFAGTFVTLFRVGDGFPGLTELAVAFFAFRLFDVVKPPPSRQLEHLPHGWGIMLDDIAAGLYAWMLVSVLRSYLGWP